MQPLATRSLVSAVTPPSAATFDEPLRDMAQDAVNNFMENNRQIHEVKLDEDNLLVENKYLRSDVSCELFGHLVNTSDRITFCNRIFGNGVDPLGRSVVDTPDTSEEHRSFFVEIFI